jgi:hypothetical protein
MKRIQNIEFYPFLFALYPSLALLGHNIEEIKAVVAMRAFLVSLLSVAFCFGALAWLLKDRSKAALVSTLGALLFFSYGHVYNGIKEISAVASFLGRHRILAPIWLALFVVGAIWIIRRQRDFRSWTPGLNLVAVVALVLPLAQIGIYQVREIETSSQAQAVSEDVTGLHLPQDQPAPDIYYIILDAYGRDDVLQEMYALDNTAFLERLVDMGFYIARCSRSNYTQTQLSLASSLNFNYIQSFGEFVSGQSTRVGLDKMIHHSAARLALERLGYHMVAFETGFKYTQVEDADLYLSPHNSPLEGVSLSGGLNGFEVMLVNTSAGRLIKDAMNILPGYIKPVWEYPEQAHRDLVLFDLEQLHQLPGLPGPKFIFAHVVAPHPPYVFEADGSVSPPDKPDFTGYRDQVLYLNNKMETLLVDIIQSSATPPIIIIQGDHGPILAAPRQRLKILNTYYLPGNGAERLYPTITPVNTFRLVFDAYFGGQYGLLDDVSYFSSYQDPYTFITEPDDRTGCEGQ